MWNIELNMPAKPVSTTTKYSTYSLLKLPGIKFRLSSQQQLHCYFKIKIKFEW